VVSAFVLGSEFVLERTACGMEVHWVQGISVSDSGHWGHPAPHGEPVVQQVIPRLGWVAQLKTAWLA